MSDQGAASGEAAAEFSDVITWAGGPLPQTVERKARLLLLDSLGCILAGLRHAEVQRIAAALASWFPGHRRLPGLPTPLGPAGAAAIGAAAMCWDEANEGLARAHGRPALPLVPALLAISDRYELGRMLHALAVGYEVGARAGELWRVRPGMHVDGSWHALGAAAACAWIAGADAGRAVRIAACQVPFSLYRPLSFGMTGRNTYPAHAALLGIFSAAAAEAGSDAPRGGLAEARRLALLAETPPQRTEAGTWLIEESYLKPFAGVRHGHYAAAAAIEIRRRLSTPNAITEIRLETYGEALRYASNRAPRTPLAAQFSLSFAAAAGLRFGDLSPDVYRALDDPELVRLEALVELDEIAATGDRRIARLIVRTSASELRAEVDTVPGDPSNPMTEAAVEEKFLRFVGHLHEAPTLARAILRGPLNCVMPL
jgi:2-methylcitrate dehydratase PrpD